MPSTRNSDPMRNFSMHRPEIVKQPYAPKPEPPWWGGRPMDAETAERRDARSAEAALERGWMDIHARAACGRTFEWPEDSAGRRKPRTVKQRGRALNRYRRAKGEARRAAAKRR